MAFWTWPTSFPTKNQPSVQTIRPTLRCSRCSSPELSVNAPSQKDTSGPAEGIPGCGTGENPRSWAVPEEKLWWYIHFEQLHSQIGFCCAVFYRTHWPRKMKLIGFFSLLFSVCEVWAHGFGGLKSVMKNSGSLPQEMDGQILRPGERFFWCSSD